MPRKLLTSFTVRGVGLLEMVVNLVRVGRFSTKRDCALNKEVFCELREKSLGAEAKQDSSEVRKVSAAWRMSWCGWGVSALFIG